MDSPEKNRYAKCLSEFKLTGKYSVRWLSLIECSSQTPQHAQEILDDHVGRVFKTPPAQTPQRSFQEGGPLRSLCDNLRGFTFPGKNTNQFPPMKNTMRRAGAPTRTLKEPLDLGPGPSDLNSLPRTQPRAKRAALSSAMPQYSGGDFDLSDRCSSAQDRLV